ncbi:MAG: hypothetical protein QM796_12175 [Chthoniobacteraceae bacterium]
MSGYIDFQSEAEDHFEARQRIRRKALSTLRGWLLEKAQPRWRVFGCFVGALLPASLAMMLALRCGISPWGPAPAIGFFMAWPSFTFLLAYSTNPLSKRIELGEDWRWFMARDDDDLARETVYENKLREQYWTGFDNGMRTPNSGGYASIGTVFIILVSLGTWLVWDLARLGPNLLAETILDKCWDKSHSTLAQKVSTEKWWPNIMIATAMHFLGLALVALLLGGFFSYLVRMRMQH